MSRVMGILSLVALLLVSACSGTTAPIPTPTAEEIGTKVQVTGGYYTKITVAELQTMLLDKDFTLVGVTVPNQGVLPGTDLYIPSNVLTQNLDQLPDKNARIVLYCYGGEQSATVAATLVGLGYTHIFKLSGGIQAWQAAGLPLMPTATP